MPRKDNVPAYEEIYRLHQANPSLQLHKLCTDRGVTYQSYNNWRKKTKGSAKEAEVIRVPISLEKFVEHYLKGDKTFEVSLQDALDNLSQEQRRLVATQIGLMQLEAGIKKD